MAMSRLEALARPRLEWGKVEEIPGFPLACFEDVQSKVTSGEFVIGIHFTVANQFAGWLYGNFYAIMHSVLAATPVLLGIASVAFAVILQNYWLLFGTCQ